MKALLLLVLAAASLTGCAVYVPTTAIMPLVRAPKEADVRINIHPLGKLEATAAYSPLAHLVVSGTGMLGLRTGGKEYLRTRQGELGLGGYWLLGSNERWLLNATVGTGLANVSRRDCVLGCSEIRGRYDKRFGQLGATYTLNRLHFDIGLNYRLSQVQFNSVETETGPMPKFGSYRHDLTFAFRHSLNSTTAKWYLQSALGASISNIPTAGEGPNGPTEYSDQWSVGCRSIFTASLGVGYYFRRP